MYYDTSTNTLYYWNSQVWVPVNGAPLVTGALPSSPVDGQEVYYQVSASLGINWHLRFRSSLNTYKWEYLGGPPLVSEVDTDQSTTSAAFVDLATVQSVTVPLNGEYDVYLSALVYNVGAQALMSMAAVRSPGGAQLARIDGTGITAYGLGPISQRQRATIAAADVVKMQFATHTGTGHWGARRMTITPVRCI
jgi:hypothetical protein